MYKALLHNIADDSGSGETVIKLREVFYLSVCSPTLSTLTMMCHWFTFAKKLNINIEKLC